MQSDKRICNPELDNTINIFLRQRDIGDIFFQVQKCSFILKIFEAYSLSSSSLIILVCKVDQKPINMKPVKQHITKMPGPEKKPYQLYRSQRHTGKGSLIFCLRATLLQPIWLEATRVRPRCSVRVLPALE